MAEEAKELRFAEEAKALRLAEEAGLERTRQAEQDVTKLKNYEGDGGKKYSELRWC